MLPVKIGSQSSIWREKTIGFSLKQESILTEIFK